MGSEDVETSIHVGHGENSVGFGSFVPGGNGGKGLRIQHLSAATGLILTYLIEIGVQIFLTIQFCHSVIKLPVGWDWFWTVVLSLVISSLVVSTVSLIWVCHSLDFAGRLCGRLLCYVMHVFLLGIPWRYLKLAFAYDPTDVQEFIALRIFQTYVQSLPLTSIHLAALITFQQNWTSVGVCLVGAECVSIVIALIIASYSMPIPAPTPSADTVGFSNQIKKIDTKNKTTRCFQENLKCSTSPSSNSDESVLWCRVLKIELNILSRALLLMCRIVTVALLLFMIKYWTILFVGLHLTFILFWVHVMTKDDTWTISRSLESSYVTFWDITSTLCGELRLVTWFGPVFLVILENSAILAWVHWNFGEMGWLVSGTCGSLVVGSVLFGFLNLSKLTPWRRLFGTRVHKISVPCSTAQSEEEGEEKILQIISNVNPKKSGNLNLLIQANNYTNISGKLETVREIRVNKDLSSMNPGKRSCSSQWEEAMTKLTTSPHNRANDTVVNLYSSVDAGRTIATSEVRVGHFDTSVPDTCCNDSNGSSNSRNTNTLLDSTPLEGEVDESFEDTLQSSDFVFCFPPGTNNSTTIPKEPKRINPVEIKTASRVIMNIPKHEEKQRSRCPNPCPCQEKKASQALELEQNLIEAGSYGILFCEPTSHGRKTERITSQSSGNQNQRRMLLPPLKLRVLCAKCLQNHDPLLTDCQDEDNDNLRIQMPPGPTTSRRRISSIITLPSETTDYPSETEMTWTGVDDAESEVTSLHSSPSAPGRWTQCPMLAAAMLNTSPAGEGLSKEFTSKEYVRTWLLSSQTLHRHYRHQQQKVAQNLVKYRTLPYHPYRQGRKFSKGNTVISHSAFENREAKQNYLEKQPFYKDLEIIV